MLQKLIQVYMKKSPQQRFLLIIAMLFFLIYLTLGLLLLFWKSLPLQLNPMQRTLFGSLVVVYALFRFWRFYQSHIHEQED
ncbi:MAG: hypothetical protein CFE24_04795 [Flavobacterium sp. BFFFF2]|nr:MAG: hypothetical protein CFE24_04795 [Flavobacterium sp. BFFFF2]